MFFWQNLGQISIFLQKGWVLTTVNHSKGNENLLAILIACYVINVNGCSDGYSIDGASLWHCLWVHSKHVLQYTSLNLDAIEKC